MYYIIIPLYIIKFFSQDKPFISFHLPFVSIQIQNHQHMWAEMSDLLFPGKSYAIFNHRWREKWLRRWPLVTKLLLWLTKKWKQQPTFSSVICVEKGNWHVSALVVLLRQRISAVRWFSLLGFPRWKSPKRRQLGFLLTSGLILCRVCQLASPKTIFLTCH